MTIEAILKEVPIFSLLPAELLAKLVETGQILSFATGQIVCREGEASEGMYIILDGHIRVFKQDEKGNEVDMAVLKPGDFFGEMALLDSQPRSATTMCLTPCRLFMLEKLVFMKLLLTPETQIMALSVFSALVERVRALSKKYFEDELAQRTFQAEMEAERHRSLAQMVAGVAHELNTPLGIVNTAVDMIEKRVQNDKLTGPLRAHETALAILADMQEAAHLARRNIGRAHKLVQNFKKISVSQLTATRETVDLPALVLDILELFKINARRAKLEIAVNGTLPEDQKAWSGYPGYLTQVLTNLLFNIETYAYPDQVGGRVEIDIGIGLGTDQRPKPASFILTVRDFGRGIAPDHLPQVFTPFFTTGRGKGGTGLGLAIVHNIVTKALQGTITVESELNEGTTFRVIFPQVLEIER